MAATSPAAARHHVDAFRRELRELGYIEGQSIIIEERWAEGKLERFGDLIADRQSRAVNGRVGRQESQAARCYERMRRWRRWNYAIESP